MSRRPLILGEAPSRSGDRYWMAPLSGEVGRRLCSWAGIPPRPPARGQSEFGRYYWALRAHFDVDNVIERYPGPSRYGGPGAGFPTEPALRGVDRLALDGDLDGRVVVVLGARLRSVFGADEFHRWRHDVVVLGAATRSELSALVAVPHPSGLNRTLNSDEERERVGATLRRAMELAGGGE